MFEPMNFVDNLHYMGLGMLGIFIVIGIIAALTMILNAFATPKKEEDHDEKTKS